MAGTSGARPRRLGHASCALPFLFFGETETSLWKARGFPSGMMNEFPGILGSDSARGRNERGRESSRSRGAVEILPIRSPVMAHREFEMVNSNN